MIRREYSSANMRVHRAAANYSPFQNRAARGSVCNALFTFAVRIPGNRRRTQLRRPATVPKGTYQRMSTEAHREALQLHVNCKIRVSDENIRASPSRI